MLLFSLNGFTPTSDNPASSLFGKDSEAYGERDSDRATSSETKSDVYIFLIDNFLGCYLHRYLGVVKGFNVSQRIEQRSSANSKMLFDFVHVVTGQK